MAALPVIGQALGALAVFVGLFMLLDLPVAVVCSGTLLFVGSLVAEVLSYPRPASKPKPVAQAQARPAGVA